MKIRARKRTAGLYLLLILLVLLVQACTPLVKQEEAAHSTPACHAVYDAGSKSTRLYVYEKAATGWIKHSGPKTGALADPVRAVRGKTMSNANQVIDDIVTALESIRTDGPRDKKAKPKWPAFDWQKECRLASVSVLATAGMRLAEEKNPQSTQVLWKMLNEQLSSAVQIPVTTRTLSGFEEGLYTWLALADGQKNEWFGVMEMGGASTQITFPCVTCDNSKNVMVKGQIVPVFSYSFLGWGQDEAYKKFGSLSACERGAGLGNPDWQIADCAVGMAGFSKAAVEVKNSVRSQAGLRWYLSDAFRYMKDTDIDQFCRVGADSGFEPKSSCFRAVYLQEVIHQLGLPLDAATTEAAWTLGAVICTATRCLEFQ